MAEGSPLARSTGSAASRAIGSARTLAVVALAGVGLLAWIAIWMLSSMPAAPSAADDRRPREPGPGADSRRAPAPPPSDAELLARIGREAQRLRRSVRVVIPVVDRPEGPAGVRVRVADPWGAEPGAAPSPAPERLATAPGEPITLEVPGWWPELSELQLLAEGAAPIELERIVLPGVGVRLDPVRLVAGLRVRGRVLAPGGGAAPHVQVAALPVGSDPLAEAGGALGLRYGEAGTDSRGEFVLEHLPARRVRLEVTGGRGWSNGVAVEHDVTSPPATLHLAPAASIAGRVVDPAGRPLAGSRVSARMAGPDETSGGISITGEDGGFVLASLAPGYYVVSAGAAGRAPIVIARVHTDVRGLRLVLHELATARVDVIGAPDDLDVPVTWRTWSHSGARLRPTGARSVAWLRGGSLSMRGIPAGAHALEISVPGARSFLTPVVEFALDRETEVGSFTLAAGATLTATVRDPDGRPLPARVALASPHHTAIARERDPFALPDRLERVCSEEGRLEWIALPPGERVIAFRHDGSADVALAVTIPDGGGLELGPVTLGPAGSIEGELRTHGGRPLADVEITAGMAGVPARSAVTALDGRFEFPRLVPGRWELTVLGVDQPSSADLSNAFTPRENVTRRVDVAAGERRRCDIAIESP